MDIVCRRCGEPWDAYGLRHEGADYWSWSDREDVSMAYGPTWADGDYPGTRTPEGLRELLARRWVLFDRGAEAAAGELAGKVAAATYRLVASGRGCPACWGHRGGFGPCEVCAERLRYLELRPHGVSRWDDDERERLREAVGSEWGCERLVPPGEQDDVTRKAFFSVMDSTDGVEAEWFVGVLEREGG